LVVSDRFDFAEQDVAAAVKVFSAEAKRDSVARLGRRNITPDKFVGEKYDERGGEQVVHFLGVIFARCLNLAMFHDFDSRFRDHQPPHRERRTLEKLGPLGRLDLDSGVAGMLDLAKEAVFAPHEICLQGLSGWRIAVGFARMRRLGTLRTDN
jgi:hypothetical protein